MQVATTAPQTWRELLAVGPDMAEVLAAVARTFILNISRFYVTCKGNKEGFRHGFVRWLLFDWSIASR
jgi:hypothetical protein